MIDSVLETIYSLTMFVKSLFRNKYVEHQFKYAAISKKELHRDGDFPIQGFSDKVKERIDNMNSGEIICFFRNRASQRHFCKNCNICSEKHGWKAIFEYGTVVPENLLQDYEYYCKTQGFERIPFYVRFVGYKM